MKYTIISEAEDRAVIYTNEDNFVDAIKEIITEYLTSEIYEDNHLDVVVLLMYFKHSDEVRSELKAIHAKIKKMTNQGKDIEPDMYEDLDRYREQIGEHVDIVVNAEEAYNLIRHITDSRCFDDGLHVYQAFDETEIEEESDISETEETDIGK